MTDQSSERNEESSDLDARIRELFSRLSDSDIEDLEEAVRNVLYSLTYPLDTDRLFSAVRDALPPEFRDDENSAGLFLYAITRTTSDEVERLVGQPKGSRVVRIRKRFGHLVDNILYAAEEGPDDWRSLRVRRLISEGRERELRVEVEIMKNDQTRIRLDGPPSSMGNLIRILLNYFGDFSDEFLDQLSARQMERLLSAIKKAEVRLTSYRESTSANTTASTE